MTDEAEKLAEEITEAKCDHCYFHKKGGNGWTLEYRSQHQDWVAWWGGQVEGKVIGGDNVFEKWAAKLLSLELNKRIAYGQKIWMQSKL